MSIANAGLEFSQPRLLTLPTGAYNLREAVPTEAFWRAFKKETFEALASHGVTLVKSSKGWLVQVVTPVEGAAPILRPLYTLENPAGLREWQVGHTAHLVAVLDRYGAALDGSDTGTGKTYAAAAVARARGLKPLVVAPLVGLRKWADVMGTMNAPFTAVCGWEESKTKSFPYTFKTWRMEPYETADPVTGRPIRKSRKVLESVQWKVPKNAMLIFDEAHRAKGDNTQNARFLAASKGTPTLMLSATIAESPLDMWACGYRLGLHNRMNFREFCQSLYCFKAKKGWSIVDRKMAAEALHRLVFPEHGARIRIKELGDRFPSNNLSVDLITIEDADALNSKHDELISRVKQLQELGKNADVLVERLRYRQSSELAKVPSLAEMAEDMSDEGNAVVIFCCFRETMEQLRKAFSKPCSFIVGGQTMSAREENRVRFQRNETDIIVVMIQAGGESCDLHDLMGKPRVALLCPCDNARMLKQALGRIHRDGALSPARQMLIYAAGTVEEEVYKNALGKIHAIESVNDGDLADASFTNLDPTEVVS